ncbi:S41 family peptidase [Croceitalea marina]|uniref:S41 family peptidase n=1 Tax=Croceitalea marina TaxID=1775166 RepID=A0ABW5MYQ2_9FLAO
MKKIAIIISCSLTILSCSDRANNARKRLDISELENTSDSITYFLDSTFAIIKRHGLYKDKLDWENIHDTYYKPNVKKDSLEAIFSVFSEIFNTMEDKHSMMWHGKILYSATIDFNDTLPEAKETLREAYKTGEAVLMAKRIEDYGYIRIPYLRSSDDFEEEVAKSQEIQDMICDIYSDDIKGWILDLRLNGGGDMFPMISGIQQFLGEGTFASVLEQHKTTDWYIKDGGVYYDKDRAAELKNYCLPKNLINAKVAVLTSQFTASSGEITGLAFKGRPNTIFIGERSKGLMTANEVYSLPFGEGIEPLGIILTLSIGYEQDRNNNQMSFLRPDIYLFEDDNFHELEKDKKVIEAIKWFKSDEKI